MRAFGTGCSCADLWASNGAGHKDKTLVSASTKLNNFSCTLVTNTVAKDIFANLA